MEGDKKKRRSQLSGREEDFDADYERLTSENVKKASDAVFNATEEDLKKTFKSNPD